MAESAYCRDCGRPRQHRAPGGICGDCRNARAMCSSKRAKLSSGKGIATDERIAYLANRAERGLPLFEAGEEDRDR